MVKKNIEDTKEWDLKDRDARFASGELTEDIEDPTEIAVKEDE